MLDAESYGSFKILVRDIRKKDLNGANMLLIPRKDLDMLHTQIVDSDRLARKAIEGTVW